MLRDHSNKWKQKHTSFWWKPLRTNHKMPHSFTLIVFLRENELFQRGWGVFVTLVEIPEGWGAISFLQKWKIQGGGGVLSEIPSVLGVWIFSGTTQFRFDAWDRISETSNSRLLLMTSGISVLSLLKWLTLIHKSWSQDFIFWLKMLL